MRKNNPPVILISSFKSYHKVLFKTLTSITENIEHLDVHIVTQPDKKLEASFPRFKFTFLENDLGWSGNILELLSQYSDEQGVILTMDDLVVDWCSIDFGMIKNIVNEKKFDFISLYQTPVERIISFDDSQVQNQKISIYNEVPSLTCMFAFYKVGFLKKFLMLEYSAWDFERKSKSDILKSEETFITGKLVHHSIELRNLVVKGKVVKRRSLNNDLGLPQQSLVEAYFYRGYIVAHLLKLMFKTNYFIRVLKFIWK